MRAVLDRLEPTPAFVVNRLGEVLAFTAGYERLARPVGLLDASPPSLVRFVFTDARARGAYPDWERVADEHVAGLKLESYRADPHVAGLVEELTVTAGAPFAERLEAPTVVPRRSGVSGWCTPRWASYGWPTRPSSCPTATTSAWWSSSPPTTPPPPRSTASPGATPARCAR